MKKSTVLVALLLCLTLLFPAGLAESAAPAYIPGEPMDAIFASAFDAGKLITGEVSLKLDVDPTLIAPEDDAAEMAAGLAVLNQATITLGAGKIDDGLRVLLGGTLHNPDRTNSVNVSATLDLTKDRLIVESDLIAGRRVSAAWETLLALAGMPQEQIALFTSLKSMDVEALMTTLAAQVPALLETAALIAAPYGETVGSFIATLPMTVEENLTVEDYPPTALEVGVTFTQQDMGTLLGLLADQLEQDATLLPLIEQALASSGETMTGADVIAAIRAYAAGLTDVDTPISVYLGMNEENTPLYLEVYITDEPTGESIYGGVFCYEAEPSTNLFEVVFGMFDAQQAPLASIYAGGTLTGDLYGADEAELFGELYAVEGETPLAEMQLTYTGAPTTTEDGLPAYTAGMSYSVYALEGESETRIMFSQDMQYAMTEAGGEITAVNGTMDTYAGETTATTVTSGGMFIEPTADGGLTGYYCLTESMPSMGLNSYEMNVAFATQDIDLAASAALPMTTLETITIEEMEALSAEVSTALQVKGVQAMAMLPQDVLEQLMQSETAE